MPVQSSAIAALGYDAYNEELEVEFTSGTVYRYTRVDDATWAEFMSAKSIGRFYCKAIKGLFESIKLCWACQHNAADPINCKGCQS